MQLKPVCTADSTPIWGMGVAIYGNRTGGEDLASPMSLAGHVQKFECRKQGVSFKSAWLGFDQPRPCRLGAKEYVTPAFGSDPD